MLRPRPPVPLGWRGSSRTTWSGPGPRCRERYFRAMRIGVLTSGGDCPGLNAVIRSVVHRAVVDHGDEVIGFQDGWKGLLECDYRKLDLDAVGGILARGGTILGSSRVQPAHLRDGVERAKGHVAELGLDAIIPIGGEGTLKAARLLSDAGLPDRGRARRPSTTTSPHRRHLRLRHRGRGRDRGAGPAEDHRRVAPAGAGRRGHGPAHRLDRAALRHGGRRARHRRAGAALRHRRAGRAGSGSGSRRARSSRSSCVAEGAKPRDGLHGLRRGRQGHLRPRALRRASPGSSRSSWRSGSARRPGR